MKYLELVRYKNLLIVVLTMLAMRYLVLQPMLATNSLEFQLSNFGFFLLVFATVLTAASGYVINDYFDVQIDLLNREKTVLISRKIPAKRALNIYYGIVILAFISGFWAAQLAGLYQLGFIFLIVAGLLWYYSTLYKRQFLIGNLIVSALTGLVPILVALFDIPALNKHYLELLVANQTTLNYLFFWTVAFGAFAFLATLMREIVKDMEDLEGDASFNRRTLPIVIGFSNSKLVLYGLITLLIAGLVGVYYIFLEGSMLSWVYFVVFLMTPFVLLGFKIRKAQQKTDYTKISRWLKLLMLSGISFSGIVFYIFTYTL